MNSKKKTKKQLLEELEELKDKLFFYERYAKEREYDENRLHHLASFPELTPSPIIEIDETKTITYCNEASFEIFKKLKAEQDLYLFLPDDIDIMVKELCNGKNNTFIREKILNDRIFEEYIYLISKIKVIRIFIIDVTEAKTSEKELIKTKQLLEKITNTSPAIISVFDIKTEKNIYQNRSLLFTLGYTNDEINEIVKSNPTDSIQSIHPDDVQQLDRFYQSLNSIQDGQNYETEFRILDKYKKWQWIRRVYSVFTRDKNGYPSQLVSIFENINDRKNYEEQLKNSETSLLQAQMLAKLGHFEYEVKTKKVTWSPETFKIIGCEHLTEAPSFEEYWSYIHPDDVELVRSTNFNAIRDAKPYKYEYRIIHKTEGIKYIQSIGRPICDNDGNILRIFGTIIDITDSKKAEESHRINDERFRVALKSSPVIVLNQDKDLKFTWIYNQGSQYSDTEIIGKTDYDFIPFDEAEELTKIKREVIKTGKGKRTEIWLHRGNEYNCYDLTVEPLLNLKNEIEGITCSVNDISERKINELKLKENEIKYRGIFENVNDIIIYIDKRGYIEEINKKAENILGYKREELIGKNFLSLDIFAPDVFKKIEKKFEDAVLNPHSVKQRDSIGYTKNEIEVKAKDGHKIIIEANTTAINEDNKLQGFLSVIRDVTNQKAFYDALLESEETSRALLNTISETVLMQDMNGIILSINDTGARRLGKSKEELIGKNVFDLLNKELAEKRKEKINIVVETKSPFKFNDSRDGYYLDNTIYPMIDTTGKINKVIIFSKDITESKLGEEKLIESEQRYRKLIETSPEAIMVHLDHKIIFANESAAELFKADKVEDLLEKNILKFIHPDSLNIAVNRIKDITLNEKRVPTIEEKLLCMDGSIIDAEVSALPLHYKGRTAVQVIVRDITEKKKVLSFLRESELKYKTLFETSNDAIFLLKDNIYIDCNSKALKMFGCGRKDLIGKTPYHFSPKFQPDGSKSEEKAAIAIEKAYNGEAQFYEWTHLKFDKNPFEAEVNLNRIELGGIPYIQKIVRDITERKQSEKALKETKLLLERIAATSPAIITVYDVKSQKNIYQNKSLLESLGYKKRTSKELQVHGFSRNDLIHKDDKKILDEEYKQIEDLKDGESYSVEYRIKGVDGKWNWIRKVYSIFQRNDSGKVEQIVSIFENVTDRKESEIALKLSEEFNRAINENSPLGISVRTKTGRLLTCNSSWEKIHDKTEKDIINDKTKERRELVLDKEDDYLNIWGDKVKEIFSNGGTLHIPGLKLYTGKSKKIKWVSKYYYAIKDTEGNVDRIVIITEDITERKLAEEAFKESQRTLVTLMGNLPGMAYRCANDRDWTMEFVSEGCHELTGYKNFELLNNAAASYSSLIHAEDTENVWNDVQTAINERRSFELIYRIITNNKKEKWVWEKGQGVYSEEGKLLALEGFITDITVRKKAEEELRKLYQGVQQSPASIIITDLNGSIEYVNPSFTNTTGYSAEEVYGNNPRLLKSGYTKPEEYNKMWETIREGREWKGVFHNKKKNGELFWESATISPIKDESGKTTHFLAVKEDITEQKRKDEKILNSLKEKEVMLREIHHRVKNNLQIISSLLKLQSSYIKDPIAYEYFTISQNRVKSMALIHQQLYRSTDLSQINFGEYIEKLTGNLINVYGINEKLISYSVSAENIFLEIDTAIPCGLIINELVSNSLKHAFLPGKSGCIEIKMNLENNIYILTVKDNGAGFPRGMDFRSTTSLGMQLVTTLTEQLDGNIELVSMNGTEFIIRFSKMEYTKRV